MSVDVKENNRVEIADFEDYKWYLISFECPIPSEEDFNNGNVRFEFEYGFPNHMDKLKIIRRTYISKNIAGCYSTGSDDVLLVHPGCSIPRSLITYSKVYNEKSPEVPTKIVIPTNFPKIRWGRSSILFMNDSAKIGFLANVYGNNVNGTVQQVKESLLKSMDIVSKFGQEIIEGMELPFGTEVFGSTRASLFTDIDLALIYGMFPKSIVVREENVMVGSEPVTVDLLYSCYKMLQSPDRQIRETALNMLARSKFNNWKPLIAWVLGSSAYDVHYYGSRSTAFRWLRDRCGYSTNPRFTLEAQKAAARELLTRITDGDLYWDNDVFTVKDAKWLEYQYIRGLATGANK